jgi:hypothetical protein
MYVHRNIEGVFVTTVAVEIKITYSDCMSVAILNQDAKRTFRIILLSLLCLALPFFSSLFHKRYEFRKAFIV